MSAHKNHDHPPVAEPKITIWDLPTRLFHGLLILSVTLALLSGFSDKENIAGLIHLKAGKVALSLIIWRIIWGFYGSETNLFTQFLPRSLALITQMINRLSLKNMPLKQKIYGHTALGGLSVLALLSLIGLQALSGLFNSDGVLFEGPFAEIGDQFFFSVSALHELVAFLLIGLILLHMAAVFYYKKQGNDLITPMITGKIKPSLQSATSKPLDGKDGNESPQKSPNRAALDPEISTQPLLPPKMAPAWAGLLAMAGLLAFALFS